jgi:hypothetical protein
MQSSSSNDIYIPRINDSYTENDVIKVFNNLHVGVVKHVDFVATKNPETKAILFYSAFVRLTAWTNVTYYKLFKEQQAPKIFVSETEFWILLPAKTIISRSKINIHQLASYSDELFVKCANLEMQVVTQSEQISMQTQQINVLTKQLSDIMSLLQPQPKEAPVQSIAEKKEPVVIMLEEKKPSEVVYCDDECFFFSPLKKTSDEITADTLLSVVKIASEAEHIKEIKTTSVRSRSVSPENNTRVKNSLYYCDNS